MPYDCWETFLKLALEWSIKQYNLIYIQATTNYVVLFFFTTVDASILWQMYEPSLFVEKMKHNKQGHTGQNWSIVSKKLVHVFCSTPDGLVPKFLDTISTSIRALLKKGHVHCNFLLVLTILSKTYQWLVSKHKGCLFVIIVLVSNTIHSSVQFMKFQTSILLFMTFEFRTVDSLKSSNSKIHLFHRAHFVHPRLHPKDCLHIIVTASMISCYIPWPYTNCRRFSNNQKAICEIECSIQCSHFSRIHYRSVLVTLNVH